MATQPLDVSGQARTALRAIAKDYGSAALSNPEFMNSLLRDMIPDSPKEANILVAAADANVAGILRERAAQHVSTAAAIAQAAVTLEERTALAPDACQWAAYHLAEALDMPKPVSAANAAGPAFAAGPTLASGSYPPPGSYSAPGSYPPPGPTFAPGPPVAPGSPVAPGPAVAPGPPQKAPPGQHAPAAIAAAVLAVVCALSVSLQVLGHGSLGASYAWGIALSALTLFVAAILTFGGKYRYTGAGMIFGAALVMVSVFIESIFFIGEGGAFVAASVVTTVTALAAGVSSMIFFAHEAHQGRANLRRPLVVAYCVAAIGYTVAFIPGDIQFGFGGHWYTVPGYLGPGVHGRYIFAGVVAIAALIVPAVVTELLAPDTGVRAGIVAGWLLVTGAGQLSNTLAAGLPGQRAASAFYVTWVFWGIALALGIALIVSDRRSRVASSQTPSALPAR